MNHKMNRTSQKRMNVLPIDYTNLNWKVIESYFQGQHLERLVRHQIESYNNFINYQIKKTIEMFNPVTIHSEHDKDEKT
jgi:DNA-directed RNA polymerase beta subunit